MRKRRRWRIFFFCCNCQICKTHTINHCLNKYNQSFEPNHTKEMSHLLIIFLAGDCVNNLNLGVIVQGHLSKDIIFIVSDKKHPRKWSWNSVEMVTSWTCSSSPSAPPDTVKNSFLSPPPPPILANSMLLSASVTAYANKYHPVCLIWFGLGASSRFSGYSGGKPDDSDCHNSHFTSHGVYLKLPASYCESVFSATAMESTKPAFHRLVAVGCGGLCSGKDDWEIKFAESVDGTRFLSSGSWVGGRNKH